MGRKFFVGGNWKMNGDKASIDTIVAFLKEGPLDPNVGKSSNNYFEKITELCYCHDLDID